MKNKLPLIPLLVLITMLGVLNTRLIKDRDDWRKIAITASNQRDDLLDKSQQWILTAANNGWLKGISYNQRYERGEFGFTEFSNAVQTVYTNIDQIP